MFKRVTCCFFLIAILVIAFIFLVHNSAVAVNPDSAGIYTGGINDIPAVTSGKPTLEEVAAVSGHNKIAINMVWTLVTGFLVMFMQAGFALVETGFVRTKNVVHTMAMNIIVYAIGMLGFWMIGFGLMFGGIGPLTTFGNTPLLNHEITISIFGKPFGLFGMKGFFLDGGGLYDVAIFTLFLFQMVFMDTAATIPTGALAERWKFLSFVIFGFFISIILYPVYGNWVWGGGWLSQLGVNFGLGHGMVDFAGSSVVHMVGGVSALAGAIVLGPRIGKYNKNGSVNAMPAHDIPMVGLGALILAFGWFGFNPGSTLAGGDLRIGIIAVNTMLASGAGAFAAMVYTWVRYKKPDIVMSINGLLAGLVAITAPCAFVHSATAVLIGAIAGILVVFATLFIERTLKIDDPVGAIAVHGVCGAWGILALGLFADGAYGDGWNGVQGTVKGLLHGDASQLMAQSVGVMVNFLFIFTVSYMFFKIIDRLIGNRVSARAELRGLDLSEMGISGYPEFALKK